MTVWRLVKAKYAATAFRGDGAALRGGRWNSPGTRVVYAAENASLAALETVVHLGDHPVVRDYLLFGIELDDAFIQDADDLPRDWAADPAPPAAAAIGDRWVDEDASVALRVPSAIVDVDHNVLLNPTHADFAAVEIAAPRPFRLDPRLTRRTD